MNVYSIDIRVAATAYVKADTEADALRKVATIHGDCLNVHNPVESEVEISSAMLDDPELPEVSISPVMTVWGPTGHIEVAADNANRAEG